MGTGLNCRRPQSLLRMDCIFRDLAIGVRSDGNRWGSRPHDRLSGALAGKPWNYRLVPLATTFLCHRLDRVGLSSEHCCGEHRKKTTVRQPPLARGSIGLGGYHYATGGLPGVLLGLKLPSSTREVLKHSVD